MNKNNSKWHAPYVNLVECKFEGEAGESAERKLPSSIM